MPGSPPRPAKAAGEAVGTAICLAEGAFDRAAAGGRIWPHLAAPAKKRIRSCGHRAETGEVTGAGKTTVMTMLM